MRNKKDLQKKCYLTLQLNAALVIHCDSFFVLAHYGKMRHATKGWLGEYLFHCVPYSRVATKRYLSMLSCENGAEEEKICDPSAAIVSQNFAVKRHMWSSSYKNCTRCPRPKIWMQVNKWRHKHRAHLRQYSSWSFRALRTNHGRRSVRMANFSCECALIACMHHVNAASLLQVVRLGRVFLVMLERCMRSKARNAESVECSVMWIELTLNKYEYYYI